MSAPRFLVLLALASCGEGSVVPPPAANGEQVPGQAMALAQGLFGVNIDVDNALGNPSAKTLSAAGVRVVRFTFRDGSRGIAPDPAALARYRAKVAELSGENISAVVLLSYETATNFPAMSNDAGAWATYRTRFAGRAGAIAGALGSAVLAYEIWNEMDEPNNRPEYAPGVPAERYGELLRDSWNAIKARSPSAVITGGADSGDADYLVRAARQVGRLYADGVGLHPYGQRPDADFPSATWGFGTLEDIVGRYHAATGLPIWITEMGTEDQTIQAEYLRHSFRRIAGSLSGQVAKAIWFCWSDGMVAPFGLVDGSGNPKPAHGAFHDFASATVAAPPSPRFPDVVVTGLRSDPAAPRPGDRVRFFATVKNRGGSGTGQHVGVAFLVDGGYVTWGAEGVLAAGEEKDGFESVATWSATAGRHTFTALADDVNRFAESDEGNNTLDLAVDVSAPQPVADAPAIRRACFSKFRVAGDKAVTIRADIEVEVPAWAWTQPMGTSAASCDFYWPGESFRVRFPELKGAWRIGVDVRGASAVRDAAGVDHPWRFGLLSDGCTVSGNSGLQATPGRYTLTGFLKLEAGDDEELSHFYAGVVQEGVAWTQDGAGCP